MGSSISTWNDIQKNNFSFSGNYRGIVEDVNDPLNAGRVRVRILGIHSPDEKETPSKHLPWAEPALSMYFGGGILNDENINEEADLEGRYKPKKDISNDVPAKNVTQLTPSDGKWEDKIANACGSPGIYTVPRLGSIVWLFFDSGDHNYPKYWATAPRKLDWEQQRNKIDDDIAKKREQIENIKSDISPDTNEYTGQGKSTKNAKVATKVSEPKMWIHQLTDIDNKNITSITSSFGSTYIIVNQNGKERLYVFNKGSAQYTDERGQTKTLVGVSNNDGSEQNNDMQMLIGNNLEIHLLGDYSVFAKNNIFLETEGNVEINSKKNIGIVAREGDIDIISAKGNCNIDVKGNCSIYADKNAQLEVSGDVIAKVSGKMDAKVDGDVVANIGGSTKIKSASDVNISCDANIALKATGDISLECNNLKIKTNSATSIDATTSVDIKGNVSIALAAGNSGLSLSPGQANVQTTNFGVSTTAINLQGQVSMGSSANGGTATSPTTQSPNSINIPSASDFASDSTDKTIEKTESQVDDSDN